MEERLKVFEKTEQVGIQNLRKQVSFDRLLARLFAEKSPQWILKGGYAMQLRIQNARATKDVDLAMKELKLDSKNESEVGLALLGLLQEQAGTDLGDYFQFIVTGPILDLNAAPYGGARFHIEARIDGRSFEKFHLDMGIGDYWTEPPDQLTSRGWLEFAGFPNQIFPALPKEQQFAEKLHAYTLPRKEEERLRVKDLVDMTLLIRSPDLDSEKLIKAIKMTFDRRGTHDFDVKLPPPPQTWGATFTVMAGECKIPSNIESAFQGLQAFVKKLPVK